MMLSFGGILSILKNLGNPVYNIILLFFSQLRINRQRERFFRCRFGLREVTLLVSEILETLLQVQRNRIVDLAADVVALQMLHQRITISRHTDHVLMKDMSPTCSN